MNGSKVFLPAKGNGAAWGLFIGLAALGAMGAALLKGAPQMEAGTRVALLPLVMIMLALSVVMGYLAYGVYTLRYTVKDDAVEVHWAFHDTIIPINRITGVERHQGTWKAIRLFGASWPGFHLGFYKVAGIGTVRLYATQLVSGELIVLKSDKLTVGITPIDTEGFIRELQSRNPRVAG